MKLQDIQAILADNKIDEAINELNALIAINPNNDEALFLRGKAYWRLGNRSRAITDYATAASINPDSPAVFALEQAREIEAFFNPDLLNP